MAEICIRLIRQVGVARCFDADKSSLFDELFTDMSVCELVAEGGMVWVPRATDRGNSEQRKAISDTTIFSYVWQPADLRGCPVLVPVVCC